MVSEIERRQFWLVFEVCLGCTAVRDAVSKRSRFKFVQALHKTVWSYDGAAWAGTAG